jgi:hypothetical protein
MAYEAFQQASSQFASHLSATERSQFRWTTVSDVQGTLRDIAKGKDGSRLLTRMTEMETVLNSLEIYTQVVEVL